MKKIDIRVREWTDIKSVSEGIPGCYQLRVYYPGSWLNKDVAIDEHNALVDYCRELEARFNELASSSRGRINRLERENRELLKEVKG